MVAACAAGSVGVLRVPDVVLGVPLLDQIASKRRKALEAWQTFTWASLKRCPKQKLLDVLVKFAPLLLGEDERYDTVALGVIHRVPGWLIPPSGPLVRPQVCGVGVGRTVP